MTKASPRYIEISRKLEDDIRKGVYPVGSLLPTEAQLCKTYRTSRFTARNALALLEEKGLIQRTQGRGSVVVSLQTSMFRDTWSSIDELLAHADTVRTSIRDVREVFVDDALSMRLGFAPGEQLLQLDGTRFQSQAGRELPVCTIRIWIPAACRPVVAGLTQFRRSIAYLLEKHYGKRSTRVDQSISACIVDAAVADILQVPEGEPALHLLRRFIDDKNRVFEASESILPASRFTYNMRLRRN